MLSGWSCQTYQEQCRKNLLLSDQGSYKQWECVTTRQRKWATPKTKTFSVISWELSDEGLEDSDFFTPVDLPVERNVNFLLKRVRR